MFNSIENNLFFLSIELFDLGTDLGEQLGVSSFEGGLILTLILCGMVLSYPLYKRLYQIAFPLLMITLCLCVGLSWLNVYVFIMLVCAIAGGLAVKFRDIIIGRFS